MKNSGKQNEVHQVERQTKQSTEKFIVNAGGNYVGQDGFVVPKNFAEFYERNPRYVRRWASKWLHKSELHEAVRDWEQDLLLYLYRLPETSKARKPTDLRPEGCTDVIECFDPYRQFGASQCRFLNFVNICLHNRSLTMAERMRRNPACRKDNISFGESSDWETFTVDDEYIHNHSQHLQAKSLELAAYVEKRFLAMRFMEFVLAKEQHLHNTLLAIIESGMLHETLEILQVDEATFARDLRRIIQLKDSFIDGGPIAKQRKLYKKRTRMH